MGLIITRKETLKETAIIFLRSLDGEKTFEKSGDLTFIKVDGNVIGVNVENYTKYFNATEGAHSLTNEQKDFLNMHGIEDTFKFFQIGEVISKESHPKSEKLYLLKVKTDKELQIVTNADNANVGLKVVVANIGTTLPSGLVIKHSKVMGIESEGMLTGGETLGQEKTDGVKIVEGNNGDEYIL